MKSSTSDGGRQSASALRKETRQEERKVEERKGSALSKGAERVEERSRSSDGKSAGQKQH